MSELKEEMSPTAAEYARKPMIMGTEAYPEHREHKMPPPMVGLQGTNVVVAGVPMSPDDAENFIKTLWVMVRQARKLESSKKNGQRDFAFDGAKE